MAPPAPPHGPTRCAHLAGRPVGGCRENCAAPYVRHEVSGEANALLASPVARDLRKAMQRVRKSRATPTWTPREGTQRGDRTLIAAVPSATREALNPPTPSNTHGARRRGEEGGGGGCAVSGRTPKPHTRAGPTPRSATQRNAERTTHPPKPVPGQRSGHGVSRVMWAHAPAVRGPRPQQEPRTSPRVSRGRRERTRWVPHHPPYQVWLWQPVGCSVLFVLAGVGGDVPAPPGR